MFKKGNTIQYVMQQLLELHNNVRANPLKLDDALNEYAQSWAETMAQKVHLIHSNMEDILKLGFKMVGENIAWNQDTASYVFDDWMRSPNHRKNIINPSFNKIGFGLACNNKNQPYWCAVFAN